MTTLQASPTEIPVESVRTSRPDGVAMAAFVAAGFGSFALGVVVLLNELGVISAPSLYGPAGGVSGRTTIAVALWLVGWAVLHQAWRGKDIDGRFALGLTLLLTLLGILGTFPPLWGWFGG